MKSRLGSGSIRKSSVASRLVTSPKPPRTSSLRTPAVRNSASSSGLLVVQRRRQVGPQRVAEAQAGHHAGDRVLAGRPGSQRLGEQVDQVEHLDVAVAQRLGERVVLVLGPADPRDAVEEQLVVVARASAASAPDPGRCSITVRSRPTSLSAPWLYVAPWFVIAESVVPVPPPPPSRRERTLGGGRVGANARLVMVESARTHVSTAALPAFAPTRRGWGVRSRRLGGVRRGLGQARTTSTRVMTARSRQTAAPM